MLRELRDKFVDCILDWYPIIMICLLACSITMCGLALC